MAHRLLTVGLVLAALGVLLLAVGPATADQWAHDLGLVTRSTSARPLTLPLVVRIPSTAEETFPLTLQANETAVGTFTIPSNRTVTLLFFDEAGFAQWQRGEAAPYLGIFELRGNQAVTLPPTSPGRHYLVFVNETTLPVTVLLQVAAFREIVTPLPVGQLGAPTLVSLGAIVAVLAARRDRRNAAERRRMNALLAEHERLARTAKALGIDTEGLSLEELRAAIRRALHKPG